MTNNLNGLPKSLVEIIIYRELRPFIVVAGEYALNRLVHVAQQDFGQSRIVGRFLLGLYDGDSYPFDLTELRLLDLALFQDCMSVLSMDYQPEVEVHQRVENGQSIWTQLVKRWAPVVTH
ncbi:MULTISPECIES: hypothetical protein [unclassified Pseudomonas]|uniref:DUF7673 family protein n=1 Tax=unclassified Pseudomonas TaxID=196821 RepID=UPI0015A7C9F8|nr:MULTISPECIES: hypothetical protein [unclassified Pseudomonas]MCU1740043.1 hypothetical protein [Pseudomonas sp. 20S_6.2_Bac1]